VDGYELMTRMQKQAERFGARASFGTVEKQWIFQKNLSLNGGRRKVEAETVIIATGASHKHLGVPGEDLLETKGVTYCATCDGALPVFRNQPLVVVGGGDSACEEALYLTRFGSVVHLVHRRDSLRASKIMAERVHAHKTIKPVWDSAVMEILDVKQDKVTGVKLKHLKTGAESILNCAGVFIAIGHIAEHGYFQRANRNGRERLHRSEGRHDDECARRVCGGRLRGPCLPPGHHGGGRGLRGGD
jgi:thioredoxin reductase (NADPH)